MPISPSGKPIVAITMGDPSGIGPEVIFKSLLKPHIRHLADYIIVGDLKTLQRTVAASGRPLTSVLSGHVSLLDLDNLPSGRFRFGKLDAGYGKASIEYLRKGFDLISSGRVDCIVTAPINKSSAKKSGFKFPGHTEFFAASAGAARTVMMLVGGPLRVSLVTRHIPFREIARRLNVRGIIDTIEITLAALKRDFGVPRPKIGVCGLNPHSGEGGIFGKEEKAVVIPAIKRFRGSNVTGPHPADAVFYSAYRKSFDAVVCLYHDQGLIPLKMIARDTGVNVTLGLGFVRTSPDHGTAFDIAGKNKADPGSMEEAIKLAVRMTGNRGVHAKQKRY